MRKTGKVIEIVNNIEPYKPENPEWGRMFGKMEKEIKIPFYYSFERLSEGLYKWKFSKNKLPK